MLPFGVQATQIHLNYWDEEKFKIFSEFLFKNNGKFLVLTKHSDRTSQSYMSKMNNFFLKLGLKFIRFFK